MELRQLGTSDVRVPPIIFGAWAIGGTFWGGSDDKLAAEAIRAGIDAGIIAIDTAPSYGFGRSERIVGQAIRGRRDEVIVATKFGIRWDRTDGTRAFSVTDQFGTHYQAYWVCKPDSIIEECEASLRRLGVDVIDLYQCHIWDRITPPEEIMETLLHLREQGKIRAIGVSNFSVELMEQCLTVGPLHSDQPKYSPMDRRIEKDVLPFCREHDIGVIVYSPLERGLLTGRVTMDRQFPEGDARKEHPWFQPPMRRRVLDALEKVKPIAEGHGATLAQVMINWVAHVPGITAAIVGARTPEQARENAGATSFTLSEEERALIAETFGQLGASV